MFTGIVEARGEVRAVERSEGSARITIRTPFEDVRLGDSLSVNGVCLTAAVLAGPDVVADVMAETLNRTTLRDLDIGDAVNLERAARLDTRLGGHLVQGHVDGVGVVTSIEPGEAWTVMSFEVDGALLRYLVAKGSIAVDGVSLTIVDADDAGFRVSLIPTTLRETSLGELAIGSRVNIEVDVIGKYIERLLGDRHARDVDGPGL